MIQRMKGTWSMENTTGFWRKLWNIKIPPNVYNFLWRALSGCLSIRIQLYQKRVKVPLQCPLCSVGIETVLHVLVDCDFAVACFNSVGLPIYASMDSYDIWFQKLLEHSNIEVVELSVMVYWAIWKARNEKCWNHHSNSALEVVASAKQSLEHWKNAQVREGGFIIDIFPCNYNQKHWMKPQLNQLKANADAAIFKETKCYGFGCLLRDHHGCVIQVISECYYRSRTPHEAEASGIKKALSWIKRNGWEDVIIESDCPMVVHAILSSIVMVSSFDSIISNCKAILAEIRNASVSFIRRSVNESAHYLARASYSCPGCIVRESDVPQAPSALISKDIDY